MSPTDPRIDAYLDRYVDEHPSTETLHDYRDGILAKDEHSNIAEHLTQCETCCSQLRTIEQEISAIAADTGLRDRLWSRIVAGIADSKSPANILTAKNPPDGLRYTTRGATHFVSFVVKQAGIAAQSGGSGECDGFAESSQRCFVVEGKSLILLLLPQSDGKHLTMEIHTTSYEPSTELDGAVVMIGESGYRIKDGRVVVPLDAKSIAFGLTTADGQNIQLSEQT